MTHGIANWVGSIFGRSSMSSSHRAYGKLRDIIERRGGTMIYQREGYPYGAWVISLDGKTATIEATGEKSFPQLDRLHVPKVENPMGWEDTHDELLGDAEAQLVALLK
jgi:hypothetical protein